MRRSSGIKEIVVGDGEARHRYVLARNPEQAKRDRAHREQILEEPRRELDSLKYPPEGRHTKAVRALRTGSPDDSRQLLRRGTAPKGHKDIPRAQRRPPV